MSGNLFTGRVVGNDPNNTVDLIGTVLVNGQPIGTGTIILGPPGATGATGASGIDAVGTTGATGPQGLQGPQGNNAISPSGLVWRGAWNETYSYSINDSVGYNGASWFAIDNIPARPTPLTPNTPPDVDTSHWALLAMQGSQGPQGPQGIAGPTGPAGSGGGSGSSVIENDITVRLFDNKTLGKYKNGDIIPSAGKTFEEVLNDIAYEYQEPSFDYFEINYSLVEVGTTFSDVSFYWNLLQNDGVVDDVTIHDNINDTDLITVPNSGYVNIPYDKTFSYEGDNISFKAIANNTSPIDTSDSKDVLVRSGYYFGYGGINNMPVDTNNGTANRDYLFNEVKNTDIIETPLEYVTDFDFKVVLDMFYFSMFTIILPKYTTYRYEFKVWDDINGVDLTSYYINTNELIIKDAAGNDIYYDQYVYEIGIPYSDADYDTDFTHTITIHGHSGS